MPDLSSSVSIFCPPFLRTKLLNTNRTKQEKWAYTYDLTSCQYERYAKARITEGYRPVSLSGHLRPPNPVERQAQNVRRAMTCCLTSNANVTGTKIPAPGPRERFSAVFRKRVGDTQTWASHHSMTTSVFEAQDQVHTRAGLKLVLINGFEGSDGEARFSAIWAAGPRSLAKWNLSSDG